MAKVHLALALAYLALALTAVAIQGVLIRSGAVPLDRLARSASLFALVLIPFVQIVWEVAESRGCVQRITASWLSIALPALAGSAIAALTWIALAHSSADPASTTSNLGHTSLWNASVSAFMPSPMLFVWHLGAYLRLMQGGSSGIGA